MTIATLILGGSRVITRFLDFVGALIVARFVTPEEFGVVLIAVTTLTLGRAVTDVPIAQSLVRKDIIDGEDLDTAFTLSLIRGCLVALVLVGLAYPFARLYAADVLVPMMLVLAAAPIAAGASSPAMVSFVRALNYQPASVAEIGGKLLGFLATTSFAMWTESAWAIVTGLVLSPLLATLATYLFAPHRPRLCVTRAREILRFAGWINLANSVATLNVEGGRFFIAGILGNVAMGLYSIAHAIAQTAIWTLSGPIVETLFTGLSQVKSDVVRLRHGYLSAQSIMVAVIFPIGVFLSTSADYVIALLFSEEWSGAAGVVTWLAPAMAIQMIAVPAQSLAMALGKSKAVFERNAVVLLVSVPLVAAGAYQWGLEGAAVGRLCGNAVWVAVSIAMANRFLMLTNRRQIVNVWRSLISATVMVGALELANRLVAPPLASEPLSTAIALAVLISVASVVYVVAHLALWVLTGRSTGCERTLLHLLASRSPSARRSAG